MRIASPKTAYLLLIIGTLSSSLAFGWTTPKRLTYYLAATDPRATSQGAEIDAVAWGYPGNDFPFFGSANSGYSWSNPIEPADTFYGGSNTPDIELIFP